MFRFCCYIVLYNANLFVSLFVSQGIVRHSGLNITTTRNWQHGLYMPYVRTSLCKIVFKSMALPVELKNLPSFKSFKYQFFRCIFASYVYYSKSVYFDRLKTL